MRSFSLLMTFLRLISLWCGVLALQRGGITFYIHQLSSVAAEVAVMVSILTVFGCILLWFSAPRLANYILGNHSRNEIVNWSSASVIFVVIILLSGYSLLTDVIPALLDVVMRMALLLSARQQATLFSASIIVPMVFVLIKTVIWVWLFMNARYVTRKILVLEFGS